jgi:hypothetical protein
MTTRPSRSLTPSVYRRSLVGAARAKTWGFHVTKRGTRCDRRRMPNYLVESYLADTPAAVEEARERARSLADDGDGVRYVRTTFLPDDETVLHVFEAASAEALERAARLAALEYERIVEAVERSADGGAARRQRKRRVQERRGMAQQKPQRRRGLRGGNG